jgi:hypothetical protein
VYGSLYPVKTQGLFGVETASIRSRWQQQRLTLPWRGNVKSGNAKDWHSILPGVNNNIEGSSNNTDYRIAVRRDVGWDTTTQTLNNRKLSQVSTPILVLLSAWYFWVVLDILYQVVRLLLASVFFLKRSFITRRKRCSYCKLWAAECLEHVAYVTYLWVQLFICQYTIDLR